MSPYGAHMRFKEQGLESADAGAADGVDSGVTHNKGTTSASTGAAGTAASHHAAEAEASAAHARASHGGKSQGTLQAEAHGPAVHEWSRIPTGQEDSRADAGLGAGGRAGPFFGMPRFASAYRDGQRKAMEEVAKAERKAAGWDSVTEAGVGAKKAAAKAA